MMRHGSLFSGIGGFDLAAEWMGWTNVFHVEQNPWCREVLEHHFPNSHSHDDIKTFDAAQYRGRIDILTGGFPCQPFSVAGKRAGMDDARWLWPEMFSAITQIRPKWVVAENVRGLLTMADQQGNPGMVFESVCADLENGGFDVWPFVLPACGAGAPHRRDRVWIVGRSSATHVSDTDGRRSQRRWNGGDAIREKTRDGQIEIHGGNGHVANADGNGNRNAVRTDGNRSSQIGERFPIVERGAHGVHGDVVRGRRQPNDWTAWPTQSAVCAGNDGFSTRLDGISVSKWKRETIKAAGNAIVPDVAHNIFRAMQKFDAMRGVA